MTRTRVVGISLAVLTGAATGLALGGAPAGSDRSFSAGAAVKASGSAQASAPTPSDLARLNRRYLRSATTDGQLRPRRMLPRTADAGISMPSEPTGRLIVKFNDDVLGRVNAGGTLFSRNDRDMGPIAEILQGSGARISPVFSKSEQRLAALERRAADLSGYAQPDLASMVYIDVPGGAFMDVAEALNELDMIEFVEVESKTTQAQAEGPTGACCLAGDACLPNVTASFCIVTALGTYQGNGTFCGGDCGTCCDIVNGNACNESYSPDRCDAIGGMFMGTVPCEPDDPCADLGEPACGEPVAGGCFDPNLTPFCDNETVCDEVCTYDPFCCDENLVRAGRGTGHWDEWCADHANEQFLGECDGGPRPANPPFVISDPTVNLADAQGYLTFNGYTDPPPANVAGGLRWDATGTEILAGFTGEGWDLQSLWQVGDLLAVDEPNGPGLAPNRARGLGIKVAVLDRSAFVANVLDADGNELFVTVGPNQPYGHEELSKVKPELGVAGDPIRAVIIPILPSLTGHHGTAMLGIIGAEDQDSAGSPWPPATSPATSIGNQSGMVGIAPDAELYYFPTVDADDPGAGRILTATESAMGELAAGDIMVFGEQLAGCGTLLSGQAFWTTIRTASDLGIASCIPAGNDGCDLSTNPQAGSADGDTVDSGAIVIGAIYPGCANIFNCYCRLGFSNFCTGCDDANSVHISAWGQSVATTGGGDLFAGEDLGTGLPTQNRTYTNSFAGTSAAAAQIAGLAACLQGLVVQWFDDGTVLSPTQIRDVIAGSLLDTGFQQCGLPIDDVPGTATVGPSTCVFQNFRFQSQNYADWDQSGTRNSVGGAENRVYTSTVAAADMILTQPWFDDSTNLVGFEVLTGEYISGTILSLAAIDQGYFIIASELSTPSTPGFDARNNLTGGKITDILVTLDFLGENVGGTMEITTQSKVTGGNGIMLVYLYSFLHNQWIIGGVIFLETVDPIPGEQVFQFANGQQFVDQSTGEMFVRLWTVSLGLSPDYRTFHDYLKIGPAANPFVTGP